MGDKSWVHEIIYTTKEMPIFVGLIRNEEKQVVPEHWHRSIEVTYVLHNDADFYINGKHQRVSPGDLILINSGLIHKIVATKNETLTNDTICAITVIIPYEFFQSVFPKLGKTFFVIKPSTEKALLIENILALGKLYDKELDDYTQMKALSIAYDMMYRLCTFFAEKKSNYITGSDQRNLRHIYVLLNYLKEHYQETIKEEELARQFSFSREYLSRMIKKYTGITFKAYLTQMRLSYAYTELVYTDNTITDIALNNGFGNVKNFIRAFKEGYRVTPGEYRKSHKMGMNPSQKETTNSD